MRRIFARGISLKRLYYNCFACILGCGFILFLYGMGFISSGQQQMMKEAQPGDRSNGPRVKYEEIDQRRLTTLKQRPTMPLEAAVINMSTDLRDEITLVTAYFNLGIFQKGEISGIKFTPTQYRAWMLIFEKINNPVIAYFDNDYDLEYFLQIRQINSNKTVINRVYRDELWSFSLSEAIREIYKDPDYPLHHPNTVDANYSCAMHAKYELMYKSVIANPFKTKYFAWIDIGLFRHLDHKKEVTFELYTPENFNEKAIAYTDVWRGFQPSLSDDKIFKGNFVWVCGCFFLGRLDIMLGWTVEYMHYTHYFVQRKLMNSDQQVIFAMFSNYSPTTNLQTYFRHNDTYNEWFYLAYICKERAFKKTKIA